MKSYFKLSYVLIIMLFGCEGYLDRYPLNNPSDVTFLSNETELTMAITGAYNSLRLAVEGMPLHMVLDQASDIGWDRNGSQLQAIGRNAHDSRNTSILAVWTGLYQGISRCNYILANMHRGKEVINSSVYNRIEAEARFLRAFYYHYLVELFGGVPLITKPLMLDEAAVPRASKEEVVSFILTELDECANNLPAGNNHLSGRATKVAAWALQSRAALYNKQWNVAIAAAQKVMAVEGTDVIIDQNYMNLFQYAGQNSKEIIFSVQFLKGVATHSMFRFFGPRLATGHTNKKPSYCMADTWECIDGLQIDESPLFNPQKPFENRDPRLHYTLAVPGSIFAGYYFETHGDSLLTWNYNVTPPRRVGNLEATHAYATFTGICWRKYVDNLDRPAVNESDMNTIVIRYAEVLLNYAEAKIESGSIDQTVLNAINKLRQRPSVNMPPITSTNQNTLRYAVRRERKYELSCEGGRLFDIRRWGIAEHVMQKPVLGRMKKSYPSVPPLVDEHGTAWYDGVTIPIAEPGEPADFKMRVVEERTFNKNRDYLWPIPDIDMTTNSNLVQNPNY